MGASPAVQLLPGEMMTMILICSEVTTRRSVGVAWSVAVTTGVSLYRMLQRLKD